MSLFYGYENDSKPVFSISNISGAIDMNDNEVLNVGSPNHEASAVSKKWVETEIAKGGAHGLSDTGFTMTGDINMNGQEILNLKDTPSADESAVNKKWVEEQITVSGHLTRAGFSMDGDINMCGYDIGGLINNQITDDSAVSKKWVEDKGYLSESGGVNMKGSINMMDNVWFGLSDMPAVDSSAVPKSWINSNFLAVPVSSDIDMGRYKITGMGQPSSDNDATTMKWVVDRIKTSNHLTNTGFSMFGDIHMRGYEIKNLIDDAVAD